MNEEQNIMLLRSRSEKIYSKGQLLDYKHYGDLGKKRRYFVEKQEYTEQSYTKVQNFLYKRALFGLGIYNKQELRELSPKEKEHIVSLQNRTRKELNKLKQQLVIKKSEGIFKLFPKSTLVQAILDDPFIDPKVGNTFSFRDFGIKKEHVIDRLLHAGILPKDFHNAGVR